MSELYTFDSQLEKQKIVGKKSGGGGGGGGGGGEEAGAGNHL